MVLLVSSTDGILVQLTPEAILELRQALREMHDHSIKIGLLGQQTEEVLLEWVTRIDHTNAGLVFRLYLS